MSSLIASTQPSSVSTTTETTDITLRPDEVSSHPITAFSTNTPIPIAGKTYDFSQEMLTQYPKLQDPAARYTLNFEAILPLLYGYPPSCLPKSLLSDRAEKEIFLSNCEFFQIKLSDEVILHLHTEAQKDIQECSSFVQKQAGKKGKKKIRFINRLDVRQFCSEINSAFTQLYQDIKPIDIVEKLELGDIKDLVLHDWKSKGSVYPFIQSFMKKFLGKASS